MTSTSVKNSLLPPGLVSNLQEVLLSRKVGDGDQSNVASDNSTEPSSSSSSAAAAAAADDSSSKPIVLVTNGDGIDSPGLTSLVDALVSQGLCNVHVCAPQSSVSFLSLSLGLSVFMLLCVFICIGILKSLYLCLFLNWFRDKSVSGHSVTLREKVAVSSAEIKGATAYEVSGTITSLCSFFFFLFFTKVLDPSLVLFGLINIAKL